MSTFPISAALKIAVYLILSLFPLLMAFATPGHACSCSWRGPFLAVAPESPLVVLGQVLRHHPGPVPTMDVLVLERISGGLLDSGLRVQMGDGMHCRPEMGFFPVGSRWILALNGPGAKPGTGLALSNCGEFWVRVENENVVGSLDGSQGETKRMPLSEFLQRLRYPRFEETFRGHIRTGERFQRAFGGSFEVVLEPAPDGWEIMVRERGREENLARLTPPLHFVPNPREIEAWHLVDAPSSCSLPYDATSVPPSLREFIFSPEVGRTIAGPQASRAVTPEDIIAVERFGRGLFTIDRFDVSYDDKGCPRFRTLEFQMRLEGGYGTRGSSGMPK
jgi:hypothetical protein